MDFNCSPPEDARGFSIEQYPKWGVIAKPFTDYLVQGRAKPEHVSTVGELLAVAVEKKHRNPKWSLLLTGGVGTGKSCFATAIFQFAAQAGIRGLWHDFSKLSTQAMMDFGRWPGIKSQMERWPFLVVDDMAATRMTPWVLDQFEAVILERKRNNLPTLITTNLTESDIEKQIDPRISSRLRGGVILNTGNKDLR